MARALHKGAPHSTRKQKVTMSISVKDSSVFTPYEISKLEDIQRLLIMVMDVAIASDAEKLGHDDEEHAYGWKHYTTAAGAHVPFRHHMATNELSLSHVGDSNLMSLLRSLDRFENRWFPRARTAIRRFVAADKREVFEAAFFEDMAQQPEGPGVVGSVEKFLSRVDAMAKADVKGAPEAYASLVKRGLTTSTIRGVKSQIAEAKERQTPGPKPKVDLAAIEAGTEQRREAYDRVNRWYNDWAETFRQELTYAQLRRLGLVSVKQGAKTVDDEPEQPVPPAVP